MKNPQFLSIVSTKFDEYCGSFDHLPQLLALGWQFFSDSRVEYQQGLSLLKSEQNSGPEWGKVVLPSIKKNPEQVWSTIGKKSWELMKLPITV